MLVHLDDVRQHIPDHRQLNDGPNDADDQILFQANLLFQTNH